MSANEAAQAVPGAEAEAEAEAVPAAVARPNEAWWQQYGGPDWLREVTARKPQQRHYGQQEAFVFGFFEGLGPVRALDFGCGFGRHLRNLKRIGASEFHGVDMSQKMVDTAREHVADPAIASRIQRIQPRSRLPFPDGYFDVVMTSEVLIHVDTLDLPAILRELWRVSKSAILHIENLPVTGSRKENLAHDGCWLHDFRALYSDIGPADLAIYPDLIEHQCVYLVTKPGATHAAAAFAAGEKRLSGDLAIEREALRKRTFQLEDELDEEAQRSEKLSAELEALKRSTSFRLAEAARSVPVPEAARSLARWVTRGVGTTAASERVETAQGHVDLPFGGFATRASLATPELFAAAQPQVVALCHPDWRGVRAATYGQVPHVLEVPGIVSDEQCARLVRFLGDCSTKTVLINGYPPNSDKLALAIRDTLPGLAVQFVYHGNASLVHFSEDVAIERMLQLCDEGAVRKIGFVKAGMAEFFRSIGYPAEHLTNLLQMPFSPPRPIGADGKLHVGVFAPNVCHKNVDTQLLAALLVPGALVHVSERPKNAYLQRARARIVEHGIVPQHEFLQTLRQMHAALYVSLVECYPMTTLEALASGVICVTSHTSIQFNDAPELFRALVCTEHDNPFAIAKRLSQAIARRDELIPLAQQHIVRLNERAEQLLKDFIGA
jgi:SAM-dependent methyltransferase/glycosyltransferase involved in cell wall biosynthesis